MIANMTKRVLSKLGPYFIQLAESSQDVFWVRSCDFQTQIYVSPAYEKIWGYSCQNLYDNPASWIDSIVNTDRDHIRQKIMDWLANPQNDSYSMQFSIKDKSGQIHQIDQTMFALYDGERCIAYAGVDRDVTQRFGQITSNNISDFLRIFIEKADTVFWVYNHSNKKIHYVSPAFEKIWGCSRQALYDEPDKWFTAIVPEDRNIQHPFNHLVADINQYDANKKIENTYRIQRTDGEIRWIRDVCFAIANEHNQVMTFAGIAEDISSSVAKESELIQAKEHAERSNQAKSNFLAMISHELRTPLNAVLGMSQLLSSPTLTLEQRDQVDVITQSGKSLLALLDDMLDFAKLEVGKLTFAKQTFRLRLLCDQVISDLRHLADKRHIALRLELDDQVPENVNSDPKRVRQIMINLISNAIKFTEHGYVNLKVSCLQRNNQEATVCFTVEDTGIGIEKEKIKTIFNRFQQINSVYQRKYEGVGLGLAIVKELVERMHGTIAVSSEVGVGSQFTCIIPFDLQFASSKQQNFMKSHTYLHHQDKPQQAQQSIANTNFDSHVLVVEDNIINQRISKTMLEQLGCKVDIAESAKQALTKLGNRYDLIFMDIGLPDMDGFETVSRIRNNESPGEHVPIIALTAHVLPHDRKHCFEVGMDEVMGKPIMQEDLMSVLKRWLTQEA